MERGCEGVQTLVYSRKNWSAKKNFQTHFFSSIFNPEHPHYQVWKFRKITSTVWSSVFLYGVILPPTGILKKYLYNSKFGTVWKQFIYWQILPLVQNTNVYKMRFFVLKDFTASKGKLNKNTLTFQDSGTFHQ